MSQMLRIPPMGPMAASLALSRLVAILCFSFPASLAWSQTAAAQPQEQLSKDRPPNIVFIFSDDHAVNTVSAYRRLSDRAASIADIAPTPNIDRLAREGALFLNSFCANSLCGPSRATVLTGKHSHANGFMKNGRDRFDQSQWTMPKTLQSLGYETAMIGKWHLNSDPVGFDHWEILPGQGNYYNPVFLLPGNRKEQIEGYVTDITTDKAIAWLEERSHRDQPFLLMCQHKAPHRTFSPALRHLDRFDQSTIPEPSTLFDDYSQRSVTLSENEMEIDRHMDWAYDLKIPVADREGIELPSPDRYGTPEFNRMTSTQQQSWTKHFQPENQKFIQEFAKGTMSERDVVRWKYQRYAKNYLATIQSVDESVGRILDYLDQHGMTENTIVVYSSDQGFYLGEHGWYDKRWMFEESLRMPLLVRWPARIKAGTVVKELVQNIDFAPTFVEAAGGSVPDDIHGQSLVPLMNGQAVNWRESIYYAYYELGTHHVPLHYGVRTERHKLIHFPETNEWNLFDLQADPEEMRSLHADSSYEGVQLELRSELERLRTRFRAP